MTPLMSSIGEARISRRELMMRRELRALVRGAEADPRIVAIYTEQEQIAVALILGRWDWMPAGYHNALDALNRIGPSWTTVVLDVRREGWTHA